MYFIFNEPTFASVGHAHPDKRGKAHSSLKGKVLFATSYKYVVKDGRKQPTYKGFFSTFGIDGNILQASVFDETGQLDEITTYKYNNAGCIEECQTIKASGAQVSRFIFKYNREHLLCSSEWRSEDDEYCGTHYYIYDSKGNLIEERWDSRTPYNRWKRIYIYDEKNQEIEMQEYKGQDNLFVRKNVQSYDSYGNVIKHVMIDSNGREEELGANVYDETGKCIEYHYVLDRYDSIKYDAKGRVIEIRPSYSNEVLKVIYNEPYFTTIIRFNVENFTILGKQEISYDIRGNITSIIEYEGDDLRIVSSNLYNYMYYPD